MIDENQNWIDGALYPDVEPPALISTLEDRIDFLARMCSAWDFGLLPRMETIREVRDVKWREAVEHCRLLTSPTYHLLREWHQLEPLPYLGRELPYIRDDPNLKYV
jgi:hypothetical protein